MAADEVAAVAAAEAGAVLLLVRRVTRWVLLQMLMALRGAQTASASPVGSETSIRACWVGCFTSRAIAVLPWLLNGERLCVGPSAGSRDSRSRLEPDIWGCWASGAAGNSSM